MHSRRQAMMSLKYDVAFKYPSVELRSNHVEILLADKKYVTKYLLSLLI